MKIKNTAAFPLKRSEDQFNPGMTLRDYFAGQAIIGIVTKGIYQDFYVLKKSAEFAYEVADSLLIERQKYEPKNNG